MAAILTASDSSKLLGYPPSEPASASLPAASSQVASSHAFSSGATDVNWRAVNRVLRRQARFLTWYFAFIAVEGFCFGMLARKYGDWQGDPKRYRSGLWLIRTFVLPNISEWHLLLTSFNWPKKEGIDVSVDILQNDGNLYQGRVADYFIDSDGKLTGILLENVNRFDREAHNVAMKTSTAELPISSAAFWRTIPGSRFYIGQSSISNLNVRFVARNQTLISVAEKILDAEDTNTYEVVVESEDEAANSEYPDIYS